MCLVRDNCFLSECTALCLFTDHQEKACVCAIRNVHAYSDNVSLLEEVYLLIYSVTNLCRTVRLLFHMYNPDDIHLMQLQYIRIY